MPTRPRAGRRESKPVVIKIVCGPLGERTPFDDQYVVDYDPSQDGTAPDGRSMNCHLICHPNINMAWKFESAREAIQVMMAVDPRKPRRDHDGKPNRPITYFTVAVEPYE